MQYIFTTILVIIFENKSDVILHQNNAALNDRSIYGELKQTKKITILSNTSVHFSNNTSLVGNNVYVYIQAPYNETCLCLLLEHIGPCLHSQSKLCTAS